MKNSWNTFFTQTIQPTLEFAKLKGELSQIPEYEKIIEHGHIRPSRLSPAGTRRSQTGPPLIILRFFNQILVDIIGLQEVRSIGSNIDVLDVPGFQSLIFKSRSLNRGGGVGFYVRSGISTKIIEKLSVFQLVYLNLFVLSLVIQLVKLFGLFLFIGFQAV